MKRTTPQANSSKHQDIDNFAVLIALPQVERLRLLRELRGGAGRSAVMIRARVLVKSIEVTGPDQD